MNKHERLETIKDMAIAFLYMDIITTDIDPRLTVIHPIYESAIQCIEEDGKFKFYNIVEGE